jgi:hypothetical protein
MSEAELIDLDCAGGFRQRPDGLSLEAKLFAHTARDAAAFGKANFRLDEQKIYTAAVSLTEPGRLLLEEFEGDGRPMLSADRDVLDQLNAELLFVIGSRRNACP